MTTISSNGKVAYIYDQETDTWYPVAGTTNTAATFSWSGAHAFGSTVSLNDVVTAKAGINNFQNPAARDSALNTPTNGLVAFVRQDENANLINQIQYYHNGIWRNYNDSAWLDTKTADYEITLADAGKTIRVASSDPVKITIPLNSTTGFIIGQRIEIIRKGTGEVTIDGPVGVTINSKYSNKRIAAQYSGAVLVKDDTNTWILIGDLKA